jgi:ABC-type branched-subunit amino acid transport system substrate-binding protein
MKKISSGVGSVFSGGIFGNGGIFGDGLFNSREDGKPFESIETTELPNNQENKKLKVALLIPLSGKAAKIGESMFNAARISVFNNSLNNITIMPYDTKATDFDAINAMNAAIRDDVDIIIGPLTTQATLATIDIAEQHNKIMISLSDNTAIKTDNRPNLYLISINSNQELDRLISYFIDEQNFYGFSALFPSNIYGNQLSKNFSEIISRKDAKIVKRDFYSTNDRNLGQKVVSLLNTHSFRNDVIRQYEEDKKIAKAEGLNMQVEFKYNKEDKVFTDALIVTDSGNDLVRIANYLNNHDTDGKKPLLVGTSKWLNSSLYNNDAFENTYFVAPNPQTYVDFSNEYYDIYSAYPLKISSFIYDAVTAIIESYAAAQSKEDIKFALENYQGFDGINGRFRFLSNGLTERKLAIIKIVNGKYEIVDYDEDPFLKY